VDTGASQKRAVRVTIFKQAYTVRTTGDVADTEALAAGVDELMNRIADRTKTEDASRVAVLTALHLADKLRSIERRAADLEERVRSFKLRGEQAERRVEELREQAHDKEERQPATAATPTTDLRPRLVALEERLAGLIEDHDQPS
jgi:cell division protein ZapA (FtsZ GTPase activity inhibitor)